MSKTYIEIPNRLFLINKRGYGGWGRSLDPEDQIRLVNILKDKDVTCHSQSISSMFQDEDRKENERCNSRVILKIDDENYNIQNYNVRCLRNESAVKIASFLIKKGLDADIEIIQGWRGSKVVKSKSTSRSMKKEVKNNDEKKQIDMFGESVKDMRCVN